MVISAEDRNRRYKHLKRLEARLTGYPTGTDKYEAYVALCEMRICYESLVEENNVLRNQMVAVGSLPESYLQGRLKWEPLNPMMEFTGHGLDLRPRHCEDSCPLVASLIGPLPAPPVASDEDMSILKRLERLEETSHIHIIPGNEARRTTDGRE